MTDEMILGIVLCGAALWLLRIVSETCGGDVVGIENTCQIVREIVLVYRRLVQRVRDRCKLACGVIAVRCRLPGSVGVIYRPMFGVVDELGDRRLDAVRRGLTDRREVDVIGIRERSCATNWIDRLSQIEVAGRVIRELSELRRAVVEHATDRGGTRIGSRVK